MSLDRVVSFVWYTMAFAGGVSLAFGYSGITVGECLLLFIGGGVSEILSKMGKVNEY